MARRKLLLTITASGTARSHVPMLQSHLRRAHALCRSKLMELSVVLAGDNLMSDLHKQFMNIEGPTDVLTFPLDADSKGRPISGEVFVCVPEARRQSRRLGTNVNDEVLLYALHGLLHLSGWDDRTAAQYRRMHRKEDTILKQLGIGPVFSIVSRKGKR